MKQKDKDLLLKDLCARLPYGVKIKTSYDKIDEPIELVFINPRNESFAIGSNFTLTSGLSFDIYECKPYLIPLSSMTEEQLFEVQEILGRHEIEIEDGFLSIVDSDRNTISYLEILALLEWFYKNHFDYRGLISMGLAIDATNLNIYYQ